MRGLKISEGRREVVVLLVGMGRNIGSGSKGKRSEGQENKGKRERACKVIRLRREEIRV